MGASGSEVERERASKNEFIGIKFEILKIENNLIQYNKAMHSLE